MPKYMVIHCKHAGCYDYNFIEDKETKTRYIPITINTPKVFVFDTRDEAREFFLEYMNDVDVVDYRCRNGNEIKHLDLCTCGVIDLDDDDHPNLFYNKNNQIFLLEYTAQMFTTNQNVRVDINNMNISNNLMRRCKNLSNEQRKKYIELGKLCEDCNFSSYIDAEKEKEREEKEKQEKEKKDADDKLIEDMKREIEKKIAEEKEKQLAALKAKEDEDKDSKELEEKKKQILASVFAAANKEKEKEQKAAKEKVVKEKVVKEKVVKEKVVKEKVVKDKKE
jgi:hypothetical protein